MSKQVTAKYLAGDAYDQETAKQVSRDLDNQNIPNWIKEKIHGSLNHFQVWVEIPAHAVVVTVRDGIVQDVENIPAGGLVMVWDWDEDAEEKVLVADYGPDGKTG